MKRILYIWNIYATNPPTKIIQTFARLECGHDVENPGGAIYLYCPRCPETITGEGDGNVYRT